jgi:redox-sensitive bicupin YhaK (pirin superfamily)
MIRVYPAASRYSHDHGWLRGHFSFSFGDYYDPDNSSFGPMRVCNDDTVAPGRGFGAHPHSDMEIVSIVLRGQLRHEDHLGNVVVTTFGEVQRMSAGTGVIHTEHNPSETEELNLLQMWFMPAQKGLQPSYEATRYDVNRLAGELLPVVSSQPSSGQVAKIHQDMTIYLSRLAAGQSLSFAQADGRRVFLFVIEGELAVNGETALSTRDSARITDTPNLTLKAGSDVFFMLIDLP